MLNYNGKTGKDKFYACSSKKNFEVINPLSDKIKIKGKKIDVEVVEDYGFHQGNQDQCSSQACQGAHPCNPDTQKRPAPIPQEGQFEKFCRTGHGNDSENASAKHHMPDSQIGTGISYGQIQEGKQECRQKGQDYACRLSEADSPFSENA